MNEDQKKDLTKYILAQIIVPRERMSDKKIAEEIVGFVEQWMDEKQLVFAL